MFKQRRNRLERRSRTRSRRAAFLNGFESLDSRVMPAVTAFFTPSAGLLTILGDSLSNNLAVSRNAAGTLLVFLVWHFGMRRLLTGLVAKRLREEDETGNLRAAFRKSTAFWRPMLAGLRGWSFMAWRRLKRVREEAEGLIEALNTRNTDPSGRLQQSAPRRPSGPEAAREPTPAPAKAAVMPPAAAIRPGPSPASATSAPASAAQPPRPTAAVPGGGSAAPLTAGLQLSPAQAAKPPAATMPAAPGAGSASPPAKSQGGPG